MGNTNIKSIMINMITLGILTFAIMSFIILVQQDGGLDSDTIITNKSYINDSYGDIKSNLNKKSQAENSLNSLNEVPPEEEVGDLNVASIVSSTWTARSVITGLWNVYIKLPEEVLKVDPIVSAAISTILLVLIGIGIWAIWKGAISS